MRELLRHDKDRYSHGFDEQKNADLQEVVVRYGAQT